MYLEPIDGADHERWRRMLELNVLAAMVATQAALPGMRKRREGHVVNISSTAGRIANASASGYAASKFALGAFSESLRREVHADNIRVTVIEPGAVATELRTHIPHAETRQSLDGWASSVRQLQGDDIANAVLYAVSQPPHVNVNEILIRPHGPGTLIHHPEGERNAEIPGAGELRRRRDQGPAEGRAARAAATWRRRRSSRWAARWRRSTSRSATTTRT
jgi:NADP-dependent 3-hydroxy acid dehydrogenase YdfG